MDLIFLAGPAAFAAGAVLAFVSPERVRSRSPRWRQALAAAAAAAAIFATAAPTGLTLWDALLRAALCAGVVLLAARARPRFVVVGAAIVFVGSIGGPLAFALAGAALGVAVATALTVRRQAPFLTSLAGLFAVEAAIRLPSHGFHGASALLAALGLAPLVIDGYLHLRTGHKRNVNRGAMAIGALTAIAIALSGLAVVLARPHLEDGLNASRGALSSGRQAETDKASRQFSGAANAFADARTTLQAVWASPGRLVPVVAQHLRLLDAAAGSGYELSVTGAQNAGVAQVEAIRVDNGRLDLERVRALEAPLEASSSALGAAHARLRAHRSPWIVGPLADRYERQLADLERTTRDTSVALQAVRVLPGLLGGDGPRRYFLAVQQPAELRGSGGIIGNFGELSAIDGRLDVTKFGRDGDLNAAATKNGATLTGAPDDYVARYSRFTPELVWQNVTMSPEFPSVAKTIGVLYPQSGGQKVDGVVSVDPTALAALLRITGPIDVPPWPEPITAENAEQILHVDQYLHLEQEVRVVFLGLVAETVTRRLTTGSLPPPPDLARILAPAVRGHHLLLHSFTGPEQALFARIGAAGALGRRPGESDVVAVTNNNAGGNKVDAFLQRHITYGTDPEGKADKTVTVELTNSAPTSGVPAVLNGSFVGDPPGTNRTYISVFSPHGLQRAILDGEPLRMESEREAGLRVYSAFIVVPPGATSEVRLLLTHDEKPKKGRLRIHRQPTVLPDRVTVTGRYRSPEHPLTEDLVITRI